MTVHHEYAVKVGDRGWAVGFGTTLRNDPPDSQSGGIYLAQGQANSAADELRHVYVNLGATDIATQVVVVARIVTTTYSGWAPPADGGSSTTKPKGNTVTS